MSPHRGPGLTITHHIDLLLSMTAGWTGLYITIIAIWFSGGGGQCTGRMVRWKTLVAICSLLAGVNADSSKFDFENLHLKHPRESKYHPKEESKYHPEEKEELTPNSSKFI